MANSPSGESVIRRLIKIISAFDAAHTSMPVAGLARRTGLPVTTTYRLVDEMLDEGLLERDNRGQVRIGVRMWELVSRSSTMLGLREAAFPFCEDVHSVVQHHTTLGVLDQDEVLYIERLSARSSALNIAKIAGRLPIHACSSGLVLLAYGPAGYQERILGGPPLTKYTDNTITDPAQLRRHLAEIRQRGYAAMRGIIVPESSGIAVPVFDAENKAVAALNVIVPAHEENTAATVPVLKAAARGISRALGWRGELTGTVHQTIKIPVHR
ncbi:IclR family transcriptional regulator [Arthrobacter sp. I2-34]|uniref:IclR family transcriptional regulator n=1 Tax=Arthrobacter hankyongi TaxID=2904801 RepID=A0ABS9L202_9MICC|nr:IclR family transcriptional regulator [Arthrobacter hankyongi]MCG2620727.1 IclR family transcriptional regulator [Arthrobacter hankyongi]